MADGLFAVADLNVWKRAAARARGHSPANTRRARRRHRRRSRIQAAALINPKLSYAQDVPHLAATRVPRRRSIAINAATRRCVLEDDLSDRNGCARCVFSSRGVYTCSGTPPSRVLLGVRARLPEEAVSTIEIEDERDEIRTSQIEVKRGE